MPMVNMISGGLHAGGNLDIQDVLIIPVGAASYSDALEMTVALYRAVGDVLQATGFESALVGDEGGYGPRLRHNEQAFEIVVDAMLACGFEPGRDVAIAVDVASTHFYDPALADLSPAHRRRPALDSQGMVDCWPAGSSVTRSSRSRTAWPRTTGTAGPRSPSGSARSVQLIGDDLFATQVARLRQGIDRRAGNAVLIKLNQVGTLSETFDALRLARDHGFRAVVSARSGETEDTTIADLAVATAAGQIKIGSVARSERLAKYNRLLRIEEALGMIFNNTN